MTASYLTNLEALATDGAPCYPRSWSGGRVRREHHLPHARPPRRYPETGQGGRAVRQRETPSGRLGGAGGRRPASRADHPGAGRCFGSYKERRG